MPRAKSNARKTTIGIPADIDGWLEYAGRGVEGGMTGYLADRLNIPLAEFSKENVRNRSAARQVPAATIESYLELLDACELYRYSKDKSQNDSPMTVFQQAVTMINEVESVLKKNRK